MKGPAIALPLLLALAACGGGEGPISPVPVPDAGATDAGAGADDAGPDAAPPAVDAGTVKRTVLTRSPFGGPAGNLFVDGDLEFSTEARAGSQLGVRAFAGDGSGDRVLVTETGGLCRSGLRCGVFQPNTLLLVRGASPEGSAGVVSAWAKVPEKSACTVVRMVLIDCDSYTVTKQLSAKKQEDDGWCHYTGTVFASDMSTCLYVDSTLKAGQTALVDHFVLGPDEGTVPMAAEHWAPDAALVGRLQAMRETVRRGTLFGRAPRRPPPSW